MITSIPLTLAVDAPGPRLNCEPCIERPSYHIRAITHGAKDSLFWNQVHSAAVQAGKDMSIDFRFDLYDKVDYHRMASDILDAVTGKDPPDALIVSIPSPVVHYGIRAALAAGIPVFGMNSGYEMAQDLGLYGFVSMDEYEAGVEAANTFVDLLQVGENVGNDNNETSAVYVNHQPGNTAMDSRFDGFRESITEAIPSVQVNEVRLKEGQSDQETLQHLTKAFQQKCPTMVLIGSPVLEATTAALYANGCALSSTTLVGTFDTTPDVYASIAVGKLAFAVSQQQHLQGTLPVVMAATYVSTGQRLAPPSQSKYGIYSSGPSIVTLQTLPSDTIQACEAEGFPVCAPGQAPIKLGGGCPCTQRSKITIAGVIHGDNTKGWARFTEAQVQQAGLDTGVDLQFELFNRQESSEVMHAKMASKIISYCRAGVHGIFVSIPSTALIPAVRECLDLNIPVMSVNTGAEYAIDELQLPHHIGQLEYTAGYAAGKYMASPQHGIDKVICIRQDQDNKALTERCKGFEAAIRETNGAVEFLGRPIVGVDNVAGFIHTVKEFVANHTSDNTWDGLGMLELGTKYVDATLGLRQDHPGMQFGAFDTSGALYNALATNDIMFGIDQSLYLQGYLPVWLLTMIATTNQHLKNRYIETGPTLVLESASKEYLSCQALSFSVCPPPVLYDLNQLTNVRPIGYTLAAIVIATAVSCIVWMAMNRRSSVVAQSQPEFLLMICFGAVCMVSAIFPLGIDDSIASTEGASKACMAIPWCVALGFTIMYAGIFCKIWRINKLMTAAKYFRRTKIQAWHVIAPLVGLSVGNVLFLAIWTGVDPMYYSREEVCGAGDFSSVGHCKAGDTKVSVAMASLIGIINITALILANVEAYRARWLNEHLSEFRYMFINLLGILQVGIIGVPLIMLLAEEPVASYFLISILLFLVAESTLLLMFVPKVPPSTGSS
ncbi:acid type B receptor subunit 1 [Seminavis robusta]|uniref:Acid type B receptor subunit 1 n=1 Tax=Seminavis robusta TaxID=568900 RepID=A0A9N8ETV4_9STRA|nr:acid type B receptor subunit 1 [Seminavis robusta]|eukprot:Sro2140_g316180.1 acid type B receptor subunit 1 (947) ;mRNA; r:1299-4476